MAYAVRRPMVSIRTETMRHLLIALLTLILGSAAFGTSCGSSVRNQAAGGSLGTPDPTQYFRLLGGDLTIKGFTYVPPVTSNGWASLVSRARSRGLARLSRADLQLLIAGSVKAYLTQVHDAQFTIRPTGATSPATASVYEIYTLDPSTGLNLGLAARSVSSVGIVTIWGEIPRLSVDAPNETRLFDTVADTGRVTAQAWSRRQDSWRCQSIDYTEQYGWGILARAGLYGALPQAALQEQGSVTGRQATALRLRSTDTTRPIRVWIDDRTFWPIQIEFLAVNGLPGVSMTLTGINTARPIQRPPGNCPQPQPR